MNRQETHELWKRCEEAHANALAQGKSKEQAHAEATKVWNGWAKPLLEKREQLEEAGEWDAAAAVIFSTREEPHTFETDVDLRGWGFPGAARFGSAMFKGDAGFGSATFEGAAWFWSATFKGGVVFESATFKGDAWFWSATFKGNAEFESATFEDDAEFESATFEGNTRFENATFKCDVGFWSATFKGYAGFGSATFKGDAGFWYATFKGNAEFESATFEGGAEFGQATFSGYSNFHKAVFKEAANFLAIKSERAFTLEKAVFKKVPDFIQANFTEAPRLDNSDFSKAPIQPRGFWGLILDDVKWFFSGKKEAGEAKESKTDDTDPNLSARYRALKHLALQGHDTDRELEFNACEIKSRRGVYDFPFRRNAWRFLLGYLYEYFSDFGRSIRTPFCWLVRIMLLFAIIYWSPLTGRDLPLRANFPPLSFDWQSVSNIISWAGPCEKVLNRNVPVGDPPQYMTLKTNAIWEAIALSARNGTVVLSIAEPNAEWRTLGCLYGGAKDSPFHRNMPRGAATAGAVQRFLSVIMIFLIGLALRNMLKLK